jgi:hypothetical protein
VLRTTACAMMTQAYRGALGYPVPGEYNGLLSNGELPQCGLCAGRENELRHLRAERDALQRQIEGRAWDHFEPGFVDGPASEDYPGRLVGVMGLTSKS